MKEFPLDRYSYYTYTNKITGSQIVVATSTYAGKTVRGTAKCISLDEFDFQKGKELAAARCAEKIALRRSARAARKLGEAERALAEAQKFYDDMLYYSQDSWQNLEDAKARVSNLVSNM